MAVGGAAEAAVQVARVQRLAVAVWVATVVEAAAQLERVQGLAVAALEEAALAQGLEVGVAAVEAGALALGGRGP